MKKNLLFTIIILLQFSFLLRSNNEADKYLQLIKGCDLTKYKNAPFVVLSDETDVKMMDSGLSFVKKEILYKIASRKGATQLHSYILSYDPASAFVQFKKVSIYKKDGRIINIPTATAKDYTAPARMIYWGAREKIIQIGRLEPGDGLLIKTFMKGFTYALLRKEDNDSKYIPPMRGHFYDIVHFYSNHHILKKTYKVSVPINKKLQFEFYNGQARHYSRIVGNRINYLWEVKNILPLKREPNMVSPSDIAPKLLLSTSPDWKAKSLWFYKVNEDYGSFEYDKEIKEKVDEIIGNIKSDWGKISALTHWVADEVRYSGLTMGEGEGFTLHKGTMTFRDRCGVCKDKAGMLITMLRAAGFKSYPAMTMAGSRIDRIPADQFNHCVTLVKVKDEYHLLDPTWVPGVRELWSSAEQQQEYLMGIPEGADLRTTPLSPPENHYIKYDIQSEIDKNGNISGKIIVRAEGQSDSGMRRGISRYLKHTWGNVFNAEFYKYNPYMKVSNLVYTDPYDISKPFKMSFDFSIPDYVQIGKKNLYIKPISSNLPFSRILSFGRIMLKLKKRRYPFRTRCSQLIQVNEKLSLPKRYKALSVKFKNIRGEAADFSGSIKQRGKTVFIKKNLKLKKRIYKAEDWKNFKESVTEFKKPIENYLILKRR